MLISRISRTAWAMGAALILGTGVATAQTPAVQSVKNILLVHGAWADGSSWSKVIPKLEASGFNVTAVQLPLTSLADDVAATERAIALEDGPVLLVGHSYGGAVISEAGNDPKVTGLVFVAAFAPDDGESALALAEANPTPIDAQLVPDANGFLKITTQGIFEDFAQRLPDVEREVLAATQGPTSVSSLGAPVTNPAWKNKPTWFVISADDRVIAPTLQAEEAQKMNAVTIILPTCHVAMLEEPFRVASFIEEAVAKIDAK
jgi:pimeloyl-ACP methyl ester carboxylesterase